MLHKIRKLEELLKREGMGGMISSLLQYLRGLSSLRRVKNMSAEEKFTWIYKNHHWDNVESASGDGSTLEYTENLRKQLPKVVDQFNINSILDAPCGDFNWMQSVINSLDCSYIGGDIVGELIEDLKSKYQTDTVRFVKLDVTAQNLPQADLMICRDCLFHLPYESIQKFLANFVESKIPYLLTTTHLNNGEFENQDLSEKQFFRRIDLFSEPFNFSREPAYRITDWVHPYAEREMCLFNRDQIKMALKESSLA